MQSGTLNLFCSDQRLTSARESRLHQAPSLPCSLRISVACFPFLRLAHQRASLQSEYTWVQTRAAGSARNERGGVSGAQIDSARFLGTDRAHPQVPKNTHVYSYMSTTVFFSSVNASFIFPMICLMFLAWWGRQHWQSSGKLLRSLWPSCTPFCSHLWLTVCMCVYDWVCTLDLVSRPLHSTRIHNNIVCVHMCVCV